MESKPHFLRDMSKEQSPDERSLVAAEIKGIRNEYFQRREREASLDAEAQQLADRIKTLNSSGMKKIWNYFRLRALRQDLETTQNALTSSQEISDERVEAKTLLDNFYQRQQKMWAELPYTPEQIKPYFTEEYLSKLSLEEYGMLLQRVPCEMTTHVTRQGIRDHAKGDHILGLDQYHDGFVQVLKDGRLKAGLTHEIMQEGKQEALAHYFKRKAELIMNRWPQEGKSLKDEAYIILKTLLEWGGIQDHTAVHLGQGVVLDDFYGGEAGNEIFLAYPHMHLAAEYQLKPTLHNNIDFHNDIWVWTRENNGLSVNAGLVFIPERTQVDPETGSKYALDRERKPIPDQTMIDALADSLSRIDLPAFIKLGFKCYNSISRNMNELHDYMNANQVDDRFHGWLDHIGMISNLHHIMMWVGKNQTPQQQAVAVATQLLKDEGLYYLRASETVSAREYWEQYFAQHPEQRPSKIVYYEEHSPTQALHTWLEDNGINQYARTQKPKAMDTFPESSPWDREENRLVYGEKEVEDFRILAEQAIENYL